MPTPITPVGTWTALIPTPDNGEGATGAGLDGFAQALADRTEYLKAVVDSTGPKRIRKVDSLVDLANVTGAVQDDVRNVPGYGLYFAFTGALGDDGVWKVEANDSSVTWLHENSFLKGTEIATVNAGTGKVVQPVPFRTVNIYSTAVAPTVTDSLEVVTTTYSTTYDPILAARVMTADAEVEADDRLIFTANFRIACASTAYAKLVVAEGGGIVFTSTDHNECHGRIEAGQERLFSWSGVHTAIAGGARKAIVGLHVRTTSASSAVQVFKPISMTLQIVRP